MRRANVVTLIFILVLLALGYFWYSYFKSRPASNVRATSTGVSQEGKEFLVLLRTLESTKLDTSFFENPLFNALKRGATFPPLPVPQGRPNPFSSLQ